MASSVILKILRQDHEKSSPYWETYQVPFKENMNVISALIEIQKKPVTLEGKSVSPPTWDAACLEEVCARSAKKKYRIFFLGASPGTSENAAENMMNRYPGCQIVGVHHGYFSPEENQEIAKKIAETHPDFLFVALGMPRQEKFILETMAIHQVPVAIGVGG